MFALQVAKSESNSGKGSTTKQAGQRATNAAELNNDLTQNDLDRRRGQADLGRKDPDQPPASAPPSPPRASWTLGKLRFSPPDRFQDRSRKPFQASLPPHGPSLFPAIQTKLIVNEPGDAFEQEADRAAGKLVETPSSGREKSPGEIARSSRKLPPIGVSHAAPKDFGMPSIDQVLRSPGRQLDPESRAWLEPRMHRDLSSVRIHADAAASLSAQSIGAHAYTSGNNIVFGAGRFSPSTAEGKRLLAHELTHVMQQDAAAAGSRAAGPAPIQRQAAAGSAAAAQKSAVVQKIVAYWHTKDVAWAYLSDGSMKTVEVVTNTLEPGSYSSTPTGPPSGPKDADTVLLAGAGFDWRQSLADYQPGATVTIEIQLTPEQRLARLPDYIRAYVARDGGKHPTLPELEKQAGAGEALVRDGITKEDLAAADNPGAAIEIKDKAPALDLTNDAEVVESMRRRGFSDFRSEKDFKNRLANQVRGEKSSLFDDKSAADYWKEFPEDAAKDWENYAQPKYKSAVHNEAEAWRVAFKRMDAAASVVNGIAWVTIVVAGAFVGAEGWAITESLDIPSAVESLSGVKFALWMKAFTATFLSYGFATSLMHRVKEAQASGTNPVSTVFAAIEDAFGVSKILEAITNKSLLTGKNLELGKAQRGSQAIVGAFETYFSFLGASEFFGEPLPSAKAPEAKPGEGKPDPEPNPDPDKPSDPQSTAQNAIEGVVQGGGQGTGVPTGDLRSVGADNTLGPAYKRPGVQDRAPTGAGAANDNVTPQPLRAVAGDPTKPPSSAGGGETGKVSTDPAAAGQSAKDAPSRPSGGTPAIAAEDAARVKQLDEWIRKGIVKRGQVAKLREQLQSGNGETLENAREEFDGNKERIESGDEDEGWEKLQESARKDTISTGTKSELEDSKWLKDRLPNPEDRREFMHWLKAGHKEGDLGPEIPEGQKITDSHEHYPPGAPQTQAKLDEWLSGHGRPRKK